MIISAAKAAEAAKKLGVELTGLTPSGLSVAYRTESKTCHPDSGEYDAARWADISWAKEVLVRWLERSPPEERGALDGGNCGACSGTGRVKLKTVGFGKPMTMACVMCAGTGDITLGGARALHGGSDG